MSRIMTFPGQFGNSRDYRVESMEDRVAAARRLLERWRSRPDVFAREALGIDPWDRQVELLRAVAEHDRVAVRSGHKVSKSNSAAILALWFALTREDARVIMTSASARQVKSILWKEIRTRHARARLPIGGRLAIDPETGLQFPDGREILGFSTNEPEKMAGVSGSNLLFIVDEASGVPEEIFAAIEGNRAGGAKIVLLSNPTRTSGTFFDAFHSKRSFWHTIRISSEDTPNVREGRIVIPGLASRPWIEEKRDEWGEDSLHYRVRVRGEFPDQDSKSLISFASVVESRARYDAALEDGDPPEGILEVGVDPARFGSDESGVAFVRGRRAIALETMSGMDGPTLAGRVMELVRDLARPGEKPILKVDVIGIGASCYDALQVYDNEVEVIAVDASRASSVVIEVEGEERPAYGTVRDELWIGARDWLRDGGELLEDSKLETELVGTQYGYDMRGRLKVESKDSMKKRLGRSPDRADAFCLAIYQPDQLFEKEYEAMPRPQSRW